MANLDQSVLPSLPSKEKDAPSPPSIGKTVDDVEGQQAKEPEKTSVFKGLGLLDQLLALWIFVAMVVGVLLGNFVPNTGPALQKGQFVGVSVPIGKCSIPCVVIVNMKSYWATCHDVPYSLQDQVRNLERCTSQPGYLDSDPIQYCGQLGYCAFSYGTHSYLTFNLTWLTSTASSSLGISTRQTCSSRGFDISWAG